MVFKVARGQQALTITWVSQPAQGPVPMTQGSWFLILEEGFIDIITIQSVRDEDFNDLIHFQGLNPLPRGKYVHKLCIEFHGHHNIVFLSLKYIQK